MSYLNYSNKKYKKGILTEFLPGTKALSLGKNPLFCTVKLRWDSDRPHTPLVK